MDGAIDFRKLLKEEKKKARQKKQQQQQEHPKPEPNTSLAAQVAATYVNTVRDEDVEAIDYDQLRRAETERAAKRQQELSMAASWTISDQPLNRNRSTDNDNDELVCQEPSSIYYRADFLSQPDHQQELMSWLQSLPDSNSNSDGNDDNNIDGSWTEMKYAKRRVALFDATASTTFPSPTGNAQSNTNYTDTFFDSYPALQRIADALVVQDIFSKDQPPNHILVNEYHPGQGIMAHTDGPAYLSRTATLSLGSDVILSFTKRPTNSNDNRKINSITTPQQQDEKKTCLLQKGSLLVFEDEAYLEYCHSIDDRILVEHVTGQCMNLHSIANQLEEEQQGVGSTITRGYRISLTFRHKYYVP